MASQGNQLPLHRFLTLIPDTHHHRDASTTKTGESAILESRSGSQTDLTLAAVAAAKSSRSDSNNSATSNASSGFLYLGN